MALAFGGTHLEDHRLRWALPARYLILWLTAHSLVHAISIEIHHALVLTLLLELPPASWSMALLG